jgi:molybdate transport system substrate-binding protein
MQKLTYITFILMISLCISSCAINSNKKKNLTVFAAASVSDVIKEIATDFEETSGIKLRINHASSGILARQIESGATCDYYISASKEWLDYIDSLDIMNGKTVQTLAHNRMALIVPANSNMNTLSTDELADLPESLEGRISIGDPAHVPAGKYALEIFQKYQLDSALNDRILPAKDVRDALFMVEMEEAPFGMVYTSDAKKSKKVKTVYEFDTRDCSEIGCYGIAGKAKSDLMNQFIDYLQSEQAKKIWKNHGFLIQ